MKTIELSIQVQEGYEIDEITFKKTKDVPWNVDEGYVEGFCYDSQGSTRVYHHYTDVFATREEMRSALAMAQISLILKHDKRYGGRVREEEFDFERMRYVILSAEHHLIINRSASFYYYLAFHTREQAELFLKEHEDLVRQYYMMD